MSTEIRWAGLADAEDLALILCEMAMHYRQAPLAEEAAIAAARAWLAGESPSYPHFALAYRDGVVAGLASVAIAHPGVDLQRLLFLKDLFVRAQFRSAGLGHRTAALSCRLLHCPGHRPHRPHDRGLERGRAAVL